MEIAKRAGITCLKASSICGGLYGVKNGYETAKINMYPNLSELSFNEKVGEYFCCTIIVASGGIMGSLLPPTMIFFSPILVPWSYYVWNQTVSNRNKHN
jgi:hypothetical protein